MKGLRLESPDGCLVVTGCYRLGLGTQPSTSQKLSLFFTLQVPWRQERSWPHFWQAPRYIIEQSSRLQKCQRRALMYPDFDSFILFP